MGLDMYLEARKYVSKHDYSKFDRANDEWPPPITEVFASLEAAAPEGLTKYSDFAGIQVSYPVGYWRKANAIHGWFVNECGGGVDECQDIYVPREKLVELRDACMAVASVNAGFEAAAEDNGLMPTPGFFFGGYEIDEYYMQDLKFTVEMIDHVLSIIPEGEWDYSFYYRASW